MIPLSKFNPLVDLFNDFIYDEVNDFQLARIRKELNNFAKSGSYHDVQVFEGMFATLTNDIPSLKKHFNAAMKSTGCTDPLIKFNYAVSLSNVYELVESVKLCNEVMNHYSDDIETLKCLLEIYTLAYDFDNSNVILERLSKLDYDRDFISTYKVDVATKSETIKKEGLNWVEIASEISRLAQIVSKEKKVSFVQQFVSLEIPNIFIEFGINANNDELMRVDNLITEAVASRPHLDIDSIFTFSCTSTEK